MVWVEHWIVQKIARAAGLGIRMTFVSLSHLQTDRTSGVNKLGNVPDESEKLKLNVREMLLFVKVSKVKVL